MLGGNLGDGEAQEGKFGKRIAQRPDLGPCLLPGPQSSPGPPVAGVADTLPSHSIAGPPDTGGAGRATTLPKGANRAGVFTPEVRQDSEWGAGQAWTPQRGLTHLPTLVDSETQLSTFQQ